MFCDSCGADLSNNNGICLSCGQSAADGAGGRRLVIGRETDCDILLERDDVSRHHAEITIRSGGVLYVRDLESSFGTFVDGQQISEGRLARGAELRLGSVVVPWGLLNQLINADPVATMSPPPPMAAPPLLPYVAPPVMQAAPGIALPIAHPSPDVAANEPPVAEPASTAEEGGARGKRKKRPRKPRKPLTQQAKKTIAISGSVGGVVVVLLQLMIVCPQWFPFLFGISTQQAAQIAMAEVQRHPDLEPHVRDYQRRLAPVHSISSRVAPLRGFTDRIDEYRNLNITVAGFSMSVWDTLVTMDTSGYLAVIDRVYMQLREVVHIADALNRIIESIPASMRRFNSAMRDLRQSPSTDHINGLLGAAKQLNLALSGLLQPMEYLKERIDLLYEVFRTIHAVVVSTLEGLRGVSEYTRPVTAALGRVVDAVGWVKQQVDAIVLPARNDLSATAAIAESLDGLIIVDDGAGVVKLAPQVDYSSLPPADTVAALHLDDVPDMETVMSGESFLGCICSSPGSVRAAPFGLGRLLGL